MSHHRVTVLPLSAASQLRILARPYSLLVVLKALG
jgi:hypothetical protein